MNSKTRIEFKSATLQPIVSREPRTALKRILTSTVAPHRSINGLDRIMLSAFLSHKVIFFPTVRPVALNPCLRLPRLDSSRHPLSFFKEARARGLGKGGSVVPTPASPFFLRSAALLLRFFVAEGRVDETTRRSTTMQPPKVERRLCR